MGPSIVPDAQPNFAASSTPTHPRLNLSASPLNSAPNEGWSGHPPILAPAPGACTPPPLQNTSQPPKGAPCIPLCFVFPRSLWAYPNPWLQGSRPSIPSAKKFPGPPGTLNTEDTLLPQGLCGCCPLCLECATLPSLPQPPFSARPTLPVPPLHRISLLCTRDHLTSPEKLTDPTYAPSSPTPERFLRVETLVPSTGVQRRDGVCRGRSSAGGGGACSPGPATPSQHRTQCTGSLAGSRADVNPQGRGTWRRMCQTHQRAM